MEVHRKRLSSGTDAALATKQSQVSTAISEYADFNDTTKYNLLLNETQQGIWHFSNASYVLYG